MHTLLKDKINEKGHSICIGFDPDVSDLHPFLHKQYERLAPESFLERWYDAVVSKISGQAHSIKFQSAFFEQFGPVGMSALRDVIMDAKKRNLFVILDAKRGDISSTMSAYGKTAFETYQADALTVLPWMGVDAIKAITPWLKKGRGAYVVWLSSNQAGRDIQMLPTQNGEPIALDVFKRFMQFAESERLTQQLGWVLGATSIPFSLLEKLPNAPHAYLLPGIGAQGAAFDANTRKICAEHPSSLFPVSRALLKPATDETIHSWEDYSKSVEVRWQKLLEQFRQQS